MLAILFNSSLILIVNDEQDSPKSQSNTVVVDSQFLLLKISITGDRLTVSGNTVWTVVLYYPVRVNCTYVEGEVPTWKTFWSCPKKIFGKDIPFLEESRRKSCAFFGKHNCWESFISSGKS